MINIENLGILAQPLPEREIAAALVAAGILYFFINTTHAYWGWFDIFFAQPEDEDIKPAYPDHKSDKPSI